MRRKDKKVTDKKIIDEILANSNVCRIAMFDSTYPYIVPVNYGYTNSFIYFHSAPEGKKTELIAKNKNVCFEIEHSHEIIKQEIACEWSTKYRSIIGFGKIKTITSDEDKKDALNIIMKHNGSSHDHEFNINQLQHVSVFKIEIEELSAKQSGDWN